MKRSTARSTAPFGRLKISVTSFPPSTVGALDVLKPGGCASNCFMFSTYASLFQSRKDRPSAIDVVCTPPSIPWAVGLLRTKKLVEAFFFHGLALRGSHQSREQHQTASAHVLCRGIEQGAVI